MSRFYGTLNAGRSTSTKCGHAKDGLSACARGWDVGAELWIHADRNSPEVDTVEVEISAGTNGAGPRMHLATVTRDGAGYCFTGGALADLIELAGNVAAHFGGTDAPLGAAARAALARVGVQS